MQNLFEHNKKRAVNGAPLSLYIETLFIVDNSTYKKFQLLNPKITGTLLSKYIQIYFTEFVNLVRILAK